MSAPNREASALEVLVTWCLRGVERVREGGAATVFGALVGVSAGVAIALLLPPRYNSTASFIAQGASASAIPGALQSLAATVGLGTAKDFSPQFYADLLTSRPVLLAALGRGYPTSHSSAPRSYLEIEGFSNDTDAQSREAALQHLQKHVSAHADVRTNIIIVAVTARDPQLSHDLLSALLEGLDSVNIGFRREQSRELRQFFEARVNDAQAELSSAEDALRRFLERNRIIQGSPQLVFEQGRLQRVVDLKLAVYTTVVQQYEQAKMQEARNVPVLTVLAPPSVPVKASGPPRRFIVVLGALIGLAAVPMLRIARDTWRRLSERR